MNFHSPRGTNCWAVVRTQCPRPGSPRERTAVSHGWRDRGLQKPANVKRNLAFTWMMLRSNQEQPLDKQHRLQPGWASAFQELYEQPAVCLAQSKRRWCHKWLNCTSKHFTNTTKIVPLTNQKHPMLNWGAPAPAAAAPPLTSSKGPHTLKRLYSIKKSPGNIRKN